MVGGWWVSEIFCKFYFGRCALVGLEGLGGVLAVLSCSSCSPRLGLLAIPVRVSITRQFFCLIIAF